MVFWFKLGKMAAKRAGVYPGGTADGQPRKSGAGGILRLAPYVLIIPIILFLALSLAGCVSTSPAIPSIYIVSLSPAKNLSTPLEVRIAYFGICGNDGSTVRCQSSTSGNVDAIAANIFPGAIPNSTNKANGTAPPSDAKNLVATAIELQKEVFASVLAAGAFFFLVGTVFLFFHKRDASLANPAKPRRSAIFRRGTYTMLGLSTMFVFAAAIATTEAGGVLQSASWAMTDTAIRFHAGRTIQVLQWMVFGFATLFTGSVPFLVKTEINGVPVKEVV